MCKLSDKSDRILWNGVSWNYSTAHQLKDKNRLLLGHCNQPLIRYYPLVNFLATELIMCILGIWATA